MSDTTFNFNSIDFTGLVHESDKNIYATINSYRSLMVETLTESSGVMTEGVQLIMEEASEHIGQKIMKILIAVKDWLIRTAKSIILKIQTLASTNKRLMNKIKPAVAEKMKESDNPLRSLKGELFDYDLGCITVEKMLGKWEGLYKGDGYDLQPDFMNADRTTVENSIKKVGELSKDDIGARVVSIIYAGAGAVGLKDITIHARKLLRKGGDRRIVQFEMKYFDVVENFENVREPIQKAFDGLIKEVDEMIKEIKTNIDSANDDYKSSKKFDDGKTPEAAASMFKSARIGYYNAKRKILTTALDTAVMMNNLKLQAAVQEMQEAKKFCVQAFHYKAVNEGAASEPYEPYLDFKGDDEGEDAAVDFDSLNETTKW